MAVYSRDLAVVPVTRFAGVVSAIHKGAFCPDADVGRREEPEVKLKGQVVCRMATRESLSRRGLGVGAPALAVPCKGGGFLS